MLIALMLPVVAVKSRTLSSFSHSANEQVCGSWEGAQTDRQPGWPAEIFHTMDITLILGTEDGQGQESALLVSTSSNPLLYGNSNFSRNLAKPAVFGFCGHCSGGLAANWSLGGEKNCIVYSLLCILINIIVIINRINISFIALLNSLYPSPRVSRSVHVFSPSRCGRRGGVGERLSSAGLLAAELNHDNF